MAHRQAGKTAEKSVQLRPIRFQRGKGVVQADRGTDDGVAVLRLDRPEFSHARHVKQLRKIHVQLVDPQADIGAAGHELGLRPGGPGGQQRAQAGRRVIGKPCGLALFGWCDGC